MEKKKILLVLHSDLFVRNYLRTGVAEGLSKNYDLSIIAANTVSAKKEEFERAGSFRGYFDVDSSLVRKNYDYFRILIFRYRKKSKTFPFRLKREIRWCLSGERNRFLNNLKNFFRSDDQGSKFRKCVFFGNPIVFPVFKLITEKNLGVEKSLEEKIETLMPDIVLFPSSAYDPVGNDVSRISKKLNIKSVFLIDNWDNLSSKSIFWTRPDFLGVWSQQHKEHARRIHSFQSDSVFAVGSPRFDSYFDERHSPQKSFFPYRYVIFCGCCLPFDEITPLKMLDEEVRSHPEIYGDLRIVYRPHPWRQQRTEANFTDQNFERTLLDPQVEEQYLENKDQMSMQTSFQPDTNYYPTLLGNAEMICGPLTTFLVESLIFNKFFLGLCYDDGVHLTSPHNSFKYYEMYKGIEEHPGVGLVRSIDGLNTGFRSAFINRGQTSKSRMSEWDRKLDYFLKMDEKPYVERLISLIESIGAKTPGNVEN